MVQPSIVTMGASLGLSIDPGRWLGVLDESMTPAVLPAAPMSWIDAIKRRPQRHPVGLSFLGIGQIVVPDPCVQFPSDYATTILLPSTYPAVC